MDTRTDFPLWSERYDREMRDVFEVQDEIARKIAEALRITLSPQEQAALSAEADGEPAGLRSVPARQELRAPADAAGSRVRAADVRERDRPRSAASRWPTRASPTSARSTTTVTGPAPAGSIARRRAAEKAVVAAAAPAGSACRPRLGLLREQAVRRGGDGRAHGHRAEARLRGRVLHARPRALRGGPLPGDSSIWPTRRCASAARTTTSTCRS